MATDLQRAFTALTAKLIDYNTLFAYADGDQPTVYSTSRLREAFDNINARFTQNWCSVVINSTLDRLTLKGWDAENEAVNAALDEIWWKLEMGLDSRDAHYDALVTTEGFIIAWKDGDNLDIYCNDPRQVVMFYDPARPKIKTFAAKWWAGDDAWYMTLYYPDRLEYYRTRSKDQPSSASAFMPADIPTAPNPYGVIPVFHFRGKGELGNIITLQDAVNKLFADMMVAAEYGAFRQRYIISNGETSTMKNSPNEIWELPAGDGVGQQTSVGQFDATPLNNYLDAINEIANSIAIISRTPKHYFYNASGQLSGEALLAMEAPLNKKAAQYQQSFGATWRELAAFVLRLERGLSVNPSDIMPVWEPVESVQPYTQAQTRQLAVSAGIPLITQLKREGWDESQITAMQKDKIDEENAGYENTPDQ